jgi:hypothetical protein
MLCFSYTVDIAGIEESTVVSVKRLFFHLPLYGDPVQYPFFTFQYPPVYSWLLYTGCLLLGINPGQDVHSLYVLGRMLNLFANIGSAWLLYRMLKNFQVPDSISKPMAALSLLFLAKHGFAVRPDSLKSFLVMAFIYCLVEDLRKQKHSLLLYVFLGIIPFVKHDSIIFIAAALYFHLAKRNFVALKKAIAGLSFAGIAMLALLFGQFGFDFFRNIIGTNIEYLNFSPLLITSWVFIKKAWLLLIICFAFFNRAKHVFRENESLQFLKITFLFVLVWSFALTLKFGSDIVYFTDLQNLSILLSALAFYHYLKNTDIASWKRMAITGSIGILFLCQSNMMRYESSPVFNSRATEANYKAEYARMNSFCTAVKNTVKNSEIMFTLDVRLTPFFAQQNCMYGYFYIYHQFLYMTTPDYPLQYVVSTYQTGNNFHQMFKDNKVKWLIIPNNEKGAYIYGRYYSGFSRYFHTADYILMKNAQVQAP